MAQEDKHLNEFVTYVDSLYQIVPPGRSNGFDVDFQKLKHISADLKQSKEHESLAGQIPENKKKNRYKDITPFDFSRVKLTTTNDDPNSDYINASFIKGADGHRNYVASQGPLPHTVLDFWQMLWQYNVTVIVMVCREIELGKKKCERYWADRDDSKIFGDITVTLSQKEDLEDGYCLRTIKARKGSETRYIQQFHYTSWPDHGVPKTCYEIISLINHVRDIQSYSKDENSPLCVHCSAGCGRTGAVMAVDYVRNLLESKRVPAGLKTLEIISEMRRQRPALVQTKDQYEFVNMAISEMFRIYMQTKSVSYKDFSTGYQQGDYVNVNMSSSPTGTLEKRNGTGPPRPATLSYENIDMIRKQQNNIRGGKNLASPMKYPDDLPPAKPSRANPRPISQIVTNNTLYTNVGNRKQSVPIVNTMGNSGDRKTSVPALTLNAKPRANQNYLNNLNSNARSPTSHSRTLSSSPLAGKEATKPSPPSIKPKPVKPDPAPKKFTASPPPKPPGGNGVKPLVAPKVTPKAVEEKKIAPPKPQRASMRKGRVETPQLKNFVKEDDLLPVTNAGNKSPKINLQKYKKNNFYNEVVLPVSPSKDSSHFVNDVDYGEIVDDFAIQRSNSTASVNSRTSTPTHSSSRSSTPPKLPARTAESQIVIGESPPALPSRTAASYMTVEDVRRRQLPRHMVEEEQQAYEAVGQPSLQPPSPKSVHAETGRRSSSNTSSGTSLLAAKAKGMLEKTSIAISKVGATIVKSREDDTAGPTPSTIADRTPTYVPGPVLQGGQDISFGKRLARKVKGVRNHPK